MSWAIQCRPGHSSANRQDVVSLPDPWREPPLASHVLLAGQDTESNSGEWPFHRSVRFPGAVIGVLAYGGADPGR
jgi:hypothetical protein